jgi:hypothetical protein
MSLVRTNSPLGKLIIRNIGDVGGPRSDLVDAELDNIIAWAKLSPRVIKVDTSVVGTITTGLDSMHSFSLPANSLAATNDWVRFRYAGNLAANDNQKRLQITFDAQVLENTGLIDIDQGWFKVDGTYTRLTATSVFAEATISFGFLNQLDGAAAQAGSSLRLISRNANLTVANLTSNAVTLLVQAETDGVAGGGTNDITQNLSIIELFQQ